MRKYISPMGFAALPMQAGERIVITDLEGQQVIDFFAVCAGDAGEFLSPAVTIDINESLKIASGDALYTNRYRKLFTILHDDVSEHDLLHPCCRSEMYDFFYGNGAGHPNCLDNLNRALGTEPARGEIVPFNIFMHTKLLPSGRISVETPLSKPGDRIELRVEIDVRVAIAACSVSESKCNGGKCGPVQVEVIAD